MTLASSRMLDVFLNYACQAKCPFCYNPPLTPELTAWRLDLKRTATLLVSGRDQGYDGVTFSGGEVTLLKELPAMILLARKAGYREVGVITNGLRLAEESYAEELVAAGLTFCCVSVHGARPRTHDRLVALDGAYEKAVTAARGLGRRGLPIVLNFVVTRLNAGELEEFVTRHAPDPSVVEIQAYLPHYEGLMATETAGLSFAVSEARPFLVAAAARAEALGAGAKFFAYNAPPCALPELRYQLRNWQMENDSLLVDPRGLEGGGFGVERRDRVKPDACASCILKADCLGFERRYVERYGDAEAKAFSS